MVVAVLVVVVSPALPSPISTSNAALPIARLSIKRLPPTSLPQGRIHRYEETDTLLKDFFTMRLSYYERRKLHMSDKLTSEWTKLDNRMRFVRACGGSRSAPESNYA